MTVVKSSISSSPPNPSLSAKEQFVYAGKIGDIPTFDYEKREIPDRVKPTPKWEFNFLVSIAGLQAVRPLLTSPAQATGQTELNAMTYLSPNLTRLRPDKFSDEFFVERRLNGFNPGQLKRVQGKPWQYAVCYDYSQCELDASGILPTRIEARFSLDGQQLHSHSIEFTLHGQTQTQRPGDRDWEWSKKLFRSAEFVSHELRSHFCRTHMNVDQYATAYYRNVVNNPIKELLEPHLECLMKLNQMGLFQLVGVPGKEGLVPQVTALTFGDTQRIIKEEYSSQTYRNWSVRQQTLPDYVTNNHFDRAAIAMWGILTEYVKRFFAQNHVGIQAYWSEIEGMSEDLKTHSILKPELGTLDIKTMQDLREMCLYVIYISTFYHSWVNNKQYEDGGDTEYATMGIWKEGDPSVAAKNAEQLITLFNLSSVRYNPIMDSNATALKDAIWQQRDRIEPGLSLDMLLMSISI